MQLAPNPQAEYKPDMDITSQEDQELRDLLSACFTGPDDHVFKEQRHFRIMPSHRFLLRDTDGVIRGNIAVHDLPILTADGEIRVAGVAEVAVHKDLRGRGLANLMLDAVHKWAAKEGFPFSLLFGNPKIYGSKGYVVCGNVFRCLDWKTKAWWEGEMESCQYKLLQPGKVWPKGKIDLKGPTF